MTFQETKLVLLSVDLAGFARATARLGAITVAEFLDDWYRGATTAVRARGGRVVKFIGDGCLATFSAEGSADAVDAAVAIADGIEDLRARHGLRVDVGANVHVAVVAEGEFGSDDDRRYDVIGSGVNHLFLMGRGAGIRISEPVFRQLPNDRRRSWDKERPPATYTFSRPRARAS